MAGLNTNLQDKIYRILRQVYRMPGNLSWEFDIEHRVQENIKYIMEVLWLG